MDSWIALLTLAVNVIGVFFTWQAIKIARMQAPPQTPESVTRSPWRLYWPVAACLLLSVSVWIPYAVRPDDLPAWPQPKSYIFGYATGPAGCEVTANGDEFFKYREKYRLAVGCYIWNGVGDVLDAPQLQVSPAHEITKGTMPLRLFWGASFPQYLFDQHANMLNEVILMLPAGVDPGQVTSFRQARSLGVRIVPAGSTNLILPLQTQAH